MRIGQNPLRNSKAPQPSLLNFSVITHLPNTTEEYHKYRFDVIKLSLMSLRKNCGVSSAEFTVWDNGSCQELRDWLIDEFQPDRFILSRNVGKSWARAALIKMFPPETLMGISDSDVYFSPGFFEEELKILQTYPNVASVSGDPIRTMFRWACEKTIKWSQENAKLEIGRFIPDQNEIDYAISIGRDPQQHLNMTRELVDYKVTYKGIEAFCEGHHMEYLGYQNKLVKAIENTYDGFAMGDEKPFDYGIQSVGLRLSTVRRVTRHIGNLIDKDLYEQACLDGVINE
jgi:hypothetical protein